MIEVATALSATANWIMASAAAAGALVAFMGLNSWRHQAVWQNDRDLARQILIGLYRHKDAVKMFRHPAVFPEEAAQATTEEAVKVREDERRYKEQVAVYEMRWGKVSDARRELYPLVLEARVVWGSDLEELMKPLFLMESKLNFLAGERLRSMNPKLPPKLREFSGEQVRKSFRVLHDDLSGTDKFNKEYELELVKIEKFLQQKLGNRK